MTLSKSDIKIANKWYDGYDHEVDRILNSIDLDENFRALAGAIIELQDGMNYDLNVARGNVDGVRLYNKFGTNNDIDTTTDPEDVWNNGGDYTGFNPTQSDGEAIEVITGNAANVGSVLSSGTATDGSATTLVDSGATFSSDGVAVGDIILNDTQGFYGYVTGVTETTLTTVRMENDIAADGANELGDSYRIATASSTGAAVVELPKMLESDYAGYLTEFVVLNGTTGVDTVGTDYIRCTRCKIILAGSGGAVDTSLTVRQTTTTANVFAVLSDGHNQSRIACDTIPAGKTLYAKTKIQMSRDNGSAGSADVIFSVRELGGVFQEKKPVTITDSQSYISDEIIPISAYSDIKWRCTEVSDSNTQITAEIYGYLVDN